jgi:hypothetical protein
MEEELYGASSTDPRSIAGMGVLNSLSGGRGDLVQQYVNEAVPLPKKADPYVAALKFFIEMGKQASQPGATVLGSITGSMGAPVDYLEAKALERQKAEQARSALGLQIAPSLKAGVGKVTYRPATAAELAQYGAETGQMGSDGKFYDLSKTASTSTGSTTVGVDPSNLAALRTLLGIPDLQVDKNNNVEIPSSVVASAAGKGLILPKQAAPTDNVEKYLQQDRVMYMNEADAIEKLKLFNVTPASPEYEDILALMTTDDENLIGRPVIQADQYLSFYIPRAGEESEFNVVTRTPMGSPTPVEILARNEEIKDLVPIVLKQRMVMNDLLPTLESAMSVLFQNPNITGSFQSYTMPIRNFMSSSFGFQDNELEDQRYLEAISNKLAPQMRPIGSGATSDMEFKAYKSAILTMENPAISNYLTLYSLDKTTRNAAEEMSMRKRLLTQNKSAEYIEDKISELDKGIYEKFERPSPDMSLQDFMAARDAWKASLPDGAVILNKDSSGNKIYPNAGTFIIKGWRGQQ